jgi:hypothetical protein
MKVEGRVVVYIVGCVVVIIPMKPVIVLSLPAVVSLLMTKSAILVDFVVV